MVLGGDSELLDLGHGERYFTPAQRRAVARRDGHCTYPACTRPAAWCDIHHLRWWSRGGRTDLDNAALLCERHHTLVHQHDLHGTVNSHGVTWHRRPHRTATTRPLEHLPNPDDRARPTEGLTAPGRRARMIALRPAEPSAPPQMPLGAHVIGLGQPYPELLVDLLRAAEPEGVEHVPRREHLDAPPAR
jgi:hypothetical protein